MHKGARGEYVPPPPPICALTAGHGVAAWLDWHAQEPPPLPSGRNQMREGEVGWQDSLLPLPGAPPQLPTRGAALPSPPLANSHSYSVVALPHCYSLATNVPQAAALH